MNWTNRETGVVVGYIRHAEKQFGIANFYSAASARSSAGHPQHVVVDRLAKMLRSWILESDPQARLNYAVEFPEILNIEFERVDWRGIAGWLFERSSGSPA